MASQIGHDLTAQPEPSNKPLTALIGRLLAYLKTITLSEWERHSSTNPPVTQSDNERQSRMTNQTTTELDPVAVAHQAAAELRRRGRAISTLATDDLDLANCRVCAIGALNYVVYGDPRGYEMLEPLTGKTTFVGYHAIQDHPELAPIAEPFKEWFEANRRSYGVPLEEYLWAVNDDKLADLELVASLFESVR